MAILSNFEVTILSPIDTAVHGIPARSWHPIVEHSALTNASDEGRADFCCKYIGVTPPLRINYLEENSNVGNEFAIDFKVHCGFSFTDDYRVEYLVFRAFLDGRKIGSGFVKRERWERSGTYRVRKKGRRYWVDDVQAWVEQKWVFDSGLHGTMRIEVWREQGRPASAGSWDHPDLTDGAILDATLIGHDGITKPARIRHASKIDMWPLATFVFEYRSQDTLRNLGIPKQSAPSISEGIIDLTHDEIDPLHSMSGSSQEVDQFWADIMSASSGDASSEAINNAVTANMRDEFRGGRTGRALDQQQEVSQFSSRDQIKEASDDTPTSEGQHSVYAQDKSELSSTTCAEIVDLTMLD